MLKGRRLFLAGIAAVWLTGCAAPPQQEIDSARAALEAAGRQEAATYAPDAWREAQAAFDAASWELQAQARKLAWTRSYDQARDQFEQTRLKAVWAKSAAEVARETARRSAEELIVEARAALEAVKASAKHPPRRGHARADASAKATHLEALSMGIDEAQQSFEARDFLTAALKAEAVKRQIAELSGDVGQAQAKKPTTS